MISPEFRATEVPNLTEAFKSYIIKNHGDSLYKDLELDFTRVANVRKEIASALYHRSDPDQLRKFKDIFLENYKIASAFQKYFTYGNNQNQVNLVYTWFDSFSKQKKQSMSATFDAISSLYNYAVCCSRIACYMDLTGDGIKEASKLFMQAGWVFEHLRTLVTGLNPSEITVDFTSEALGMLSNLMLAQAQYLFYRKAMEASMKSATLAKLSMQVSEYFKKAYELSQTNSGLKQFENGKFASILMYHTFYFEAMAYFAVAQEEFKMAGEQGKGMGKAVGYFKKTASFMEKAKSVVFQCPSNYQENFNVKYQDLIKLKDKAINENNTIYFEKEFPEAQIPKPDLQNFVKLEPVLDDLNQKLPLEDKLRFIVPPAVRVMNDEVKGLIQEMLNQQYENESRVEQEERAFLQKNGLPESLHAIMSTTELPKAVWDKIEEFQKRGAIQNIQGMMQGIEALRQNNLNIITQMQGALDEEEGSDTQLRTAYGIKWNRMPSNSLNMTFRQNLNDYQSKIKQAALTDQQVTQKYQENAECLQLLSKSRQELCSMIPQSQNSQSLANNQTIMILKQCLDKLDLLQVGRSKIMEEALQKITNFNAIEDLIAVNAGQKQKADVVAKCKSEFTTIFAQIEELDKQKVEINTIITQNIGTFGQLVSSLNNDPSKSQFFKSLDSALNLYNELQNMLHQGSQFYTRLGDLLNKMYQNVMDFRMSREMEKNELISKMGGFQQEPQIQQQQQVQQSRQNIQQQQPNPFQQQINQQQQPQVYGGYYPVQGQQQQQFQQQQYQQPGQQMYGQGQQQQQPNQQQQNPYGQQQNFQYYNPNQ